MAGGVFRMHAEHLYYLPLTYRRMRVLHPLTGTVYCAVLVKTPAGSAGETLTCDFDLIDTDGRLLLQVTDFSVKRINDFDGLVEQVGTPLELYERPQSIFVAGFIGSPKMNFLNGKYAEQFRATTIGVRSEHIEIKDHDGIWSGPVVHSEMLGSDSYIYVDVGSDEPMIVRQSGTTQKQLGDVLQLGPIGDNVHRFDANGKPIAH